MLSISCTDALRHVFR